jgi:hypothetical protein
MGGVMEATALKTIELQVAHELGDIVFLRVERERIPGMVTGFSVRANGNLSYSVTWAGRSESYHYAMELTTDYIPQYD